MPIVRRQIEELAQRILMEGLREGQHLSPVVIAGRVQEFLDGRPGEGPVMRVRPQRRKARWDLMAQNKVFKELDFDLEILFEEMREQARNLLRRHNYTEVAYHAQSRRLDIILGELNNLLFVTRNTDDRFFGIFDNFRDLSKVDLDLSTRDVVDLGESVVALPPGALATRKVDLSHLYEAAVWRVGVDANGTIISSETGQDAPFGNAFHDLVNAWRHDLVMERPGRASIEVTFPISGVETQEISITRLQLISHTPRVTAVEVFYSTDNVNYLRLPQGSNVLMTRADQEFNLDFPLTRVQYIRLVLSKDEPDAFNADGTYVYAFGLKHIGCYTIGRASQASMVSKALAPASMGDPITRVSLQAATYTPEQCRIRWYVKGIDADGVDVGDWRPVAPTNLTVPEIPALVTFGSDVEQIHRLSGAVSSHSTFKNSTLYAFDETVLPTGETSITPVFGSGQLYRGLNAWSRNQRLEKRIKRVRDSYISFDNGDRQNIWATTNEDAVADTRYDPDLARDVTHLVVDNVIDYDAQTMPATPPAGVNPALDPTPRYAVHSVFWYRSDMQVTERVSVDLDSYLNEVELQYKNIILETGDKEVEVKSTDGLTTYIRKFDYTMIEKADGSVWLHIVAGGTPTSQSQFPGTGTVTVDITYNLDPDITDLVHKIVGSTVVLKEDLAPTPDQTFKLLYRFVPKGSYKIVKSTMYVTSQRGENEGTNYRQGPDFSVDVQRGTITRIASGDIRSDGEHVAVYADFYYEAPASLLETFTLWAFVDVREPQKVLFSSLGLDTEAGEQFYMRSQGETVDLTLLTETPVIGYGWHQFVVRSRNPDDHNNAAIRKVAALVDTDGAGIFIGGGKYFARIMATRAPMRQVDENYLLTNVLPANHDNFALRTDGKVIINFQPGTTTDLFTHALRLETTGSYSFAARTEEFELRYLRRLPNAVDVRKIRVKADLSRDAAADGGITPKIHNYDLKVG